MTLPDYADINGMGAVEAARMAIEDYGGTVRGKKIDLVFADTQNKLITHLRTDSATNR